jgi:alpha-galactosidase
MKKIFILSLLILTVTELYGVINPFVKWTKSELILCNGVVRRIIKLPSEGGRFLTVSYKPLNENYNSISDTCTDFQFEVNDVIYSGRGHWELVNIQVITDNNEGSGAAVKLISQDKKIELTLKFLMYPNSPAIRKSLVVKNLTDKIFKLESVDVEKLEVPGYYPVTYSWIYHDYGRRRYIGPYDGGKQDALIIVHDMNMENGIVLGN